MPTGKSLIVKVILALLLPPIGVLLEVGCHWHLLINIILTLLGFIPEVIHALYVIFSRLYTA
jgi:uncharacterized membrane protein YqaE (UPF0057 family)